MSNCWLLCDSKRALRSNFKFNITYNTAPLISSDWLEHQLRKKNGSCSLAFNRNDVKIPPPCWQIFRQSLHNSTQFSFSSLGSRDERRCHLFARPTSFSGRNDQKNTVMFSILFITSNQRAEKVSAGDAFRNDIYHTNWKFTDRRIWPTCNKLAVRSSGWVKH